MSKAKRVYLISAGPRTALEFMLNIGAIAEHGIEKPRERLKALRAVHDHVTVWVNRWLERDKKRRPHLYRKKPRRPKLRLVP